MAIGTLHTEASMKSIIPRNKPKSLVLCIIAGAVGLFVAGPAVYAGTLFGCQLQAVLGRFLLAACAGTFAFMWSLFMAGSVTGKYEKLEAQDWTHQKW